MECRTRNKWKKDKIDKNKKERDQESNNKNSTKNEQYSSHDNAEPNEKGRSNKPTTHVNDNKRFVFGNNKNRGDPSDEDEGPEIEGQDDDNSTTKNTEKTYTDDQISQFYSRSG